MRLSPIRQTGRQPLRFRALLLLMGFLIVNPPTSVNALKAPNVPPPVSVHPELVRQLKRPRVMPIQYWTEYVAVCESSLDGRTARWDDGGNWGGGLGIALSTWRGYGGKEFAPHPGKATVEQQIIVANRISVLGYQTKDQYLRLGDPPFFRPAAGFFGWGCIKHRRHLHPEEWLKNHWRKGKYKP